MTKIDNQMRQHQLMLMTYRMRAVEEFEYLTARGYARNDIYNLWRARDGDPGQSTVTLGVGDAAEAQDQEMNDIFKDLPWQKATQNLGINTEVPGHPDTILRAIQDWSDGKSSDITTNEVARFVFGIDRRKDQKRARSAVQIGMRASGMWRPDRTDSGGIRKRDHSNLWVRMYTQPVAETEPTKKKRKRHGKRSRTTHAQAMYGS